MLLHRTHSRPTLRSCQPSHKKICIYTATACVVQGCNTVGAVCKNAVTHSPAYHIVAVLVCRYGCEIVNSTTAVNIIKPRNFSGLLVKPYQVRVISMSCRTVYRVAPPDCRSTILS